MSQGSFGRVQDTQKQQIVIKKPRADVAKCIDSLQNEIHIYEVLDAVRPRLRCIPRFYKSDSTKNNFLMQKIMPSLSGLKKTGIDFFKDAFACLALLHNYILHMDLGSSNVGYRKTSNEIVFFDFGNSVTIGDLRDAGVSPKAIDLYRYSEMQELYEILEMQFPECQSMIDEAFRPYQKKSTASQQNTRLKNKLMDTAFRIVFRS